MQLKWQRDLLHEKGELVCQCICFNILIVLLDRVTEAKIYKCLNTFDIQYLKWFTNFVKRYLLV